MKLAQLFLIWVGATLLVWGLWQLGVRLNSLMTVKTELYFSIHKWASLIGSPIIAALMVLGCKNQ